MCIENDTLKIYKWLLAIYFNTNMDLYMFMKFLEFI